MVWSRLIFAFCLFGIPGFSVAFKVWRDNSEKKQDSDWSDMPRQIPILFLLSYALWWLDIGLATLKPEFVWATGFAEAWPIFGFLIASAGFLAALLAPRPQKMKLAIANLLFLALSVVSAISPN